MKPYLLMKPYFFRRLKVVAGMKLVVQMLQEEEDLKWEIFYA